MKILLERSCKLGKPGALVDCEDSAGYAAIAEGVARHPTVGELSTDWNKTADQCRKDLGLSTVAEWQDEQTKARATGKLPVVDVA